MKNRKFSIEVKIAIYICPSEKIMEPTINYTKGIGKIIGSTKVFISS